MMSTAIKRHAVVELYNRIDSRGRAQGNGYVVYIHVNGCRTYTGSRAFAADEQAARDYAAQWNAREEGRP